MQECYRYGQDNTEEMLGDVGVLSSPFDLEVCPRCGTPVEESEQTCFECGAPVRDGAAPAPMRAANKPISKAVVYGLVFQGVLAGLGFLVVVSLALHFCLTTIKAAIS